MAKKRIKSSDVEIDPAVYESQEWESILDHLEQMHRRYLALLLREGRLYRVMTERLLRYVRVRDRLEEAFPQEPVFNIMERVHAEVFEPNPEWQNEGIRPTIHTLTPVLA